MDHTKERLVDAAITLIKDKGYVATTTKDIATLAGVNESTLFRKFATKQDIVLYAIGEGQRGPDVTTPVLPNPAWDLRRDLETFMFEYFRRVNADAVKLTIGLRAPQIYEATSASIMRVPHFFITSLTAYFVEMHRRGQLAEQDFSAVALSLFASAFGYVFLHASFGTHICTVALEDYVHTQVDLLLHGLKRRTE